MSTRSVSHPKPITRPTVDAPPPDTTTETQAPNPTLAAPQSSASARKATGQVDAASNATGFAPLGANLPPALLASVKGLAPGNVRGTDPMQLLGAVKDGTVNVELPLNPGKYEVAGHGVTVPEGATMKVQMEVKDGKLVPSRDARGRDTGHGTKVEINPPLDLPLWVTGKGAYVKAEGGAQGQFKAELGGFFDQSVGKKTDLSLPNVLKSFSSGDQHADAKGGGLPPGLVDFDRMKFNVNNVTLKDNAIDTGGARIDLAPGSNVSMSGDGKHASLKGDVKLDSLAINQAGLAVKTGPGSAHVEATYEKAADGTMQVKTNVSNFNAQVDGLALSRAQPNGPADKLELGKTQLRNGNLQLETTLKPGTEGGLPSVTSSNAQAQLQVEGQFNGAQLTVKDSKDDARLSLGAGQLKGSLNVGQQGIKVDAQLTGTTVSVKDLQGQNGASGLDLHHVNIEGDAKLSLDTQKRSFDFTVQGKNIDVRLDDYRGKSETVSVDVGRTDLTGQGTVHLSDKDGLHIDGDLRLKGTVDSLKLKGAGNLPAMDVQKGSGLDLNVSHFAAGGAEKFALKGQGSVDVSLNNYTSKLPGVTATGTAHLTGKTDVNIGDGFVNFTNADARLKLDVADAKLNLPEQGVQVSAGKGTKMDLNIQELTAGKDQERTLKLGQGSTVDAVLTEGSVRTGAGTLKVDAGSRATLSLDKLTVGNGQMVDMKGKLHVEAGVGGAQQGKVAPIVTGAMNAPAGTVSRKDVQAQSAAALAHAAPAPAGKDIQPLAIAKRVQDGTVELKVPVEGHVGSGYFTSADFPKGTMLTVQAHVVGGKVVPEDTKVSFSKPGDGPAWVTVKGAYMDKSNTMRLDLGGMKDFAIPGMENMPLEVDKFMDRMTAGKADKSDAKPDLSAIKFADAQVDIKDARFKPGRMELPGGALDINESTRLSLTGNLKNATLSGRVDFNSLEVQQDAVALKAGKGAADLRVQFNTQGDKVSVSTTLSKLNLQTEYAVEKRANGDYIQLAQGQVKGGMLSMVATASLDEKGVPKDLKTADVRLSIPSFTGTMAGGRVTVPGEKGANSVYEFGRAKVSGEVYVDRSNIRFQGEIQEFDAVARGVKAKADGASVDVEYAHLKGSGKVAFSNTEGLNMEARVKDVDVRVRNAQAGGDGYKVAAQRTLIAGSGTMKFRSTGDMSLEGDLRVESGVAGRLKADEAQANADGGAHVLARVNRVDFSKKNGLRVVGSGTVDVNLDQVRARIGG